jgi:hypothetical protein
VHVGSYPFARPKQACALKIKLSLEPHPRALNRSYTPKVPAPPVRSTGPAHVAS